jgi:hypothetical protein
MILAIAGLLLSSTGAAEASVGPADDRLQSTPTGWWTYHNIDPTTLTNYLNLHVARLTDLRVTSASPLLFDAVMISNTGVYASGWWWYYGLTQANLDSLFVNSSKRIIAGQRYWTGSDLRYAVVLMPNTGSNAKSWHYYHDTNLNSIINQVYANGDRPIIANSTYSSGIYYWFVVGVANTGTDYYNYEWYFGIDTTFLTQHENPNWSIVDISANADDSLNFIAYQEPPPYEGASFFLNTTDMLNYANMYDLRGTIFTSHVLHGTGTLDGAREYITAFRNNN